MKTLKCKMCGGTLEIIEGMSVGTCEYCDSVNTFPSVNDERIIMLFERANDCRFRNEFDRAAANYENILLEDSAIAEAHWGLVLCKYGIEYVEDPGTGKRIPTCHRTQFSPIFEDNDYKAAIDNADTMSRRVYEEEAAEIDRIQQRILDISRKEKPFDVFICYKETDANKERTRDSVLAQELYNLFTKEGLKVFYAPITLEDKLGSEYEPYIFAALNSAAVMTVVMTSAENANSVWVKNEWSRYLALIKGGANKTIIPCYRDMDPYDIPKEFGTVQALDMAKLGFMQDLLRGIKKLLGINDEPVVETKIVQSVSGPGVDSLLTRGMIFVGDGNWQSANEYLDKALDIDPKSAKAYVGKLLVELKMNSEEALQSFIGALDNNLNYKKIISFGDSEMRTRFEEYNRCGYHNIALGLMNNAKYAFDFNQAAEAFLVPQLTGYAPSVQKIEECRVAEVQCCYNVAMKLMSNAKLAFDFDKAAAAFSVPQLCNHQESIKKIEECRQAAIKCYYDVASGKQSAAKKPEDYVAAAIAFSVPQLAGYGDSAKRAEECYIAEKECYYQLAMEKFIKASEQDSAQRQKNSKAIRQTGQYLAAAKLFSNPKLAGYRDTDARIQECNDTVANIADEKKIILAARKKKAIIITIIIVVVLVLLAVGYVVLSKLYEDALSMPKGVRQALYEGKNVSYGTTFQIPDIANSTINRIINK